jgi:hypothetical protein
MRRSVSYNYSPIVHRPIRTGRLSCPEWVAHVIKTQEMHAKFCLGNAIQRDNLASHKFIPDLFNNAITTA